MKKSFRIDERSDWRWWVTPKPLKEKPIHSWYTFPHSFTSDLIHTLINEWELKSDDHLLDPFAGAGTTILAAKEKRIPATGYDLSPLAVLATRTKIANYRTSRLEEAWKELEKAISSDRPERCLREYPELIVRALPGQLLPSFEAITTRIGQAECSSTERDFFQLALLAILPLYSHAIATGGWLKWVEKPVEADDLLSTLGNRIESMIEDLRRVQLSRRLWWHVKKADARTLPDTDEHYSAVITSPPYPNRHDYTRVFGVELMFGFLDWEKTRQLRYQSFHSHPEARPLRPEIGSYREPESLCRILNFLKKEGADSRISRMLKGYFLDMYLSLREVKRVCRVGAKIAYVVGNAQYCGRPLLVDELTAEIGEQADLACEKIVGVRWRGNSAQQMGQYGRKPSRESIVFFRKL